MSDFAGRFCSNCREWANGCRNNDKFFACYGKPEKPLYNAKQKNGHLQYSATAPEYKLHLSGRDFKL